MHQATAAFHVLSSRISSPLGRPAPSQRPRHLRNNPLPGTAMITSHSGGLLPVRCDTCSYLTEWVRVGVQISKASGLRTEESPGADLYYQQVIAHRA